MTTRAFTILIVSILLVAALAVVIKSVVFVPDTRQKPACINYLREIDYAKIQWARLQQKTTNDTPTWEDLRPFLKGSPFTCPNGGTYTIGRAGEMPTCSISNDTEQFRKVWPQ
jgi:hypothetical protein